MTLASLSSLGEFRFNGKKVVGAQQRAQSSGARVTSARGSYGKEDIPLLGHNNKEYILLCKIVLELDEEDTLLLN